MSFNRHRVNAIHPTTYKGGGILAHDVIKKERSLRHCKDPKRISFRYFEYYLKAVALL